MDKLKVSASLKSPQGAGASWTLEMMEPSAIIGGILSIIQPALYTAGIDALAAVGADPTTVNLPERFKELMDIWSSPYSAITAMSNRITPTHRDPKSGKAWMDMLIALGTYQKGHFEFTNLNIRLNYYPGTVVALAGRVLSHRAQCYGDRACIAYYMREKIHRFLEIPPVDWFNPEAEYLDL